MHYFTEEALNLVIFLKVDKTYTLGHFTEDAFQNKIPHVI